MTDHVPLTDDEELTALERSVVEAFVGVYGVIADLQAARAEVERLIADLRAKNKRIEELEEYKETHPWGD